MDLVSAKKEAAARSLASKKKVFINLLKDGEHELADKASDQPMVLYSNGKEIPLPTVTPSPPPTVKTTAPKKKVVVVDKTPAPKKKAVAEKKVVEAKKKVSKKQPKEKGMKKVSKVSAHKGVNRAATPKGKATVMTAKQLRKEVLEGNAVFSPTGKQIPCSLMAKNEPAKKLNVVVSGRAGAKEYHIVKK